VTANTWLIAICTSVWFTTPSRFKSQVESAPLVWPAFGASLSEAFCTELFNEAVTTAVWELETVPAVALNVALVAPGATDTCNGIVSAAALPASATAVVVLAARPNVTAQLALAPEARVVGLHDSDTKPGCGDGEGDSKAPMEGGFARGVPQISVLGAPSVVPALIAGEPACSPKLKDVGLL
jgi:hypothetical protein